MLLTEVRTDMPSIRDLELDVLDAGVGAGLGLFVLDLARGVRDVGLAGAELLEAVARAGALDRVGELRVGGRERLGHAGGDRLHGGRAGHDDRARYGGPRARGRLSAGACVAGAGSPGRSWPPSRRRPRRTNVAARARPPMRFVDASVTGTPCLATGRRAPRESSSCLLLGPTIGPAPSTGRVRRVKARLTPRRVQAVADAAHGDEVDRTPRVGLDLLCAASGRGRPPSGRRSRAPSPRPARGARGACTRGRGGRPGAPGGRTPSAEGGWQAPSRRTS